ncbi:hypothetical protein TNCV_206691 [Trichonephila clavipes]|nr:hypothetical protein TNCV_206691 [Trichonephila clavipes]
MVTSDPKLVCRLRNRFQTSDTVTRKDDNAGRHRTHIADGFLEGVNICLMDSPSRSSELNPIEYVWKIPGKVIPQRNSSPRIPLEFKVALLEENTLLPQTYIDTLVNSMTARFEACIPILTMVRLHIN